MAVYKIFPSKDTYVDENLPNNNYGRDEILELSSLTGGLKRILIEFDNDEIQNVLSLITGSYISNLKMYMAYANNIPLNYSIEFSSISSSWDMGTGRNADSTNPANGATWLRPAPLSNSFEIWVGGNTTGSSVTQSFNYRDSKDINVNVTNLINNNNRILIKNTNQIESSSADIELKYFGGDTHTIYPPSLEFKWEDTNYSSSLDELTNNSFATKITNKNIYKETEVVKIRVLCRDIFPTRSFTTSSVYLENKILPSESYWSIKDVKTDEIIVDFDSIGTKIGADEEGNYFTLYCNGLEPERFYQIIIKTNINGEDIIIDNNYAHFRIKK